MFGELTARFILNPSNLYPIIINFVFELKSLLLSQQVYS